MIQTMELSPGVTLRHCPDPRFKKSELSIQLLRPMGGGEAAKNALLCGVLLRGTQRWRDMRAITWRLDELYGAGVSTLVRRVGDVQTVGFSMSMLEERLAPEGVLAPAVEFLEEVLTRPRIVGGTLDRDYVQSEKRNLISAIESQINDKRGYAASRMIQLMCPGDSMAVPRLGEAEAVAAITPEELTEHYRLLLGTSPVEICYVGSVPMEQVALHLAGLAGKLGGAGLRRPVQTPFVPQTEPGEVTEQLTELTQGKLCMGFVTPVTNRHPDFAAMQVFNALYGAGMTSKLFTQVRERLGLCYYADSGYYSTKGIFTVSSGVEVRDFIRAKEAILEQLDCCARKEISPQELENAKAAMIASLRSTPDAPGSLEGYYATASISGMEMDIPEYIEAVERVTMEDVVRCAGSLNLHTVYFLKGVEE